jgi:hypothetical protein
VLFLASYIKKIHFMPSKAPSFYFSSRTHTHTCTCEYVCVWFLIPCALRSGFSYVRQQTCPAIGGEM